MVCIVIIIQFFHITFLQNLFVYYTITSCNMVASIRSYKYSILGENDNYMKTRTVDSDQEPNLKNIVILLFFLINIYFLKLTT